MTEELAESEIRPKVGEELEQQTRSRFSLIQLPKFESVRRFEPENGERNARFPWIHKKELVDFHLMMILPSNNQTAAPLY